MLENHVLASNFVRNCQTYGLLKRDRNVMLLPSDSPQIRWKNELNISICMMRHAFYFKRYRRSNVDDLYNDWIARQLLRQCFSFLGKCSAIPLGRRGGRLGLSLRESERRTLNRSARTSRRLFLLRFHILSYTLTKLIFLLSTCLVASFNAIVDWKLERDIYNGRK